jgi:hypothetical protein
MAFEKVKTDEEARQAFAEKTAKAARDAELARRAEIKKLQDAAAKKPYTGLVG